jgi:hypothetical protein
MNLLPDESDLVFPGFTSPIAVYRVHPGRVSGAKFVVGIVVFVALAFIGLAFYFGSNPKQINKPLIISICGGGGAALLGFAVWIIKRLATHGKQRVLLYPEGIVAWRDGAPHPFPWDKLRSVKLKHKLVTQGAIERFAYVGKDLEYTLYFEHEPPLVVNAMLDNIRELGETIAKHAPSIS